MTRGTNYLKFMMWKEYILLYLVRSIQASDSCTAQFNDTGSIIIQQLYDEIRQVECDIVAGTIYKQYDPTDGEEFDFIVVGAGAAGSVVASRLSENENWTVLVLEAGGDPTVASEIPGLQIGTFLSLIAWKYYTQPDANCCLSSVNGCYWPRGKVMGGSSAINSMMYTRGNPGDYDGWAEAGNVGWSYNDVLPYFKKSEDIISNEVTAINGYQKYHGIGGYHKIDTFPKHPFNDNLTSIFTDLGLKTYNDLNQDKHLGFFRVQGILDNSRRQLTSKAFIKSVEDRPNLQVSKFSLVTKLLIHKNNKTAYGVEFRNKEGQLIRILARKEVIVSAGTINSPQLLMLSGIGPREHLEDLNIDVVQDLPVGKNLQDHFFISGVVYSLNITLPSSSTVDEMYKYLTNTSNILGGIALLSNAVFLNMSSTTYPDVEVLCGVYNKNDTSSLRTAYEAFQLNEEVINAMIDIISNNTALFVQPIVLNPKSRGEILLKSNNSLDYPNMYPKYLSNNDDMELYLKSLRYLSDLANTKTMQSLGAKLERVKIAACDPLTFLSDAYWICLLRHMTRTISHSVGTCKMGPENDTTAVVDPSLRVIGVEKLLVVDASIMPSVVSAHTYATSVMIGEKGAEMVKSKWQINY